MGESKELIPTQKSIIPEVVDEEGNRIVGPELEAVTSLVTQLAQVAQLARIRKATEAQLAQMEKAPVGVLESIEKTITGDTPVRLEVKSPKWVGQPCTSASIHNDGDDDVWIKLNDPRRRWQRVKMDESLDFDFHGHPLIERFYFKSVPGGEANLRIALEY